VDLGEGCTVSGGEKVEVDFLARPPAHTTDFFFRVVTSANASPASSNVVVESGLWPTFSVGSQALGASTTYVVEDASWRALSAGYLSFTAVRLEVQATGGTSLSWPNSAAAYSAQVRGSVGGVATDPVASVFTGSTGGPAEVTLALARPVGTGGSLTIVVQGANPSVETSASVAVTPGTMAVGLFQPLGPTEVTNPVHFGTSVSSVRVSVSPPAALEPAVYVISFEASSAVLGGFGGASICVWEQAGPTVFSTVSSVLVADTTAGWQFELDDLNYLDRVVAGRGCDAPSEGLAIAVPAGYLIRPGDLVTLVLANVTNPPAGTVSDFAVATSSDTVPARSAPYPVQALALPGLTTTVSPSTTGAIATYTVSGLVATSPMAGGSATLTLEGPSGTVFPDNASYYSIEDLARPSGSGTAAALVSGGGTNTVTIVPSRDLAAGDILALVVEDVVNPMSAGHDYTVTVLGPVTSSHPLPPFPRASSTYPNGAVVDFAGAYYVLAGGHAFGVPGLAALSQLERQDHAVPQGAVGGSSPPLGPPRSGTLLRPLLTNAEGTVYLVGVDGLLHGFATPAQLTQDGYDPALVVTVPNLGGLPVGAPVAQLGPAGDALANSADGTIVTLGTNWWVFAGGRAFALPGQDAASLHELDKAVPLTGAPTAAQESALLATGVLISSSGVVYVSYEGELWPFKSPSQLVLDGYGGTAALSVPELDGLSVVRNYGGS
jgi:hypothetical protein